MLSCARQGRFSEQLSLELRGEGRAAKGEREYGNRRHTSRFDPPCMRRAVHLGPRRFAEWNYTLRDYAGRMHHVWEVKVALL